MSLQQAQQLRGIIRTCPPELGGSAPGLQADQALSACRNEAESAIKVPRRCEQQRQVGSRLLRPLQAVVDQSRGVAAAPSSAPRGHQTDSGRQQTLAAGT